MRPDSLVAQGVSGRFTRGHSGFYPRLSDSKCALYLNVIGSSSLFEFLKGEHPERSLVSILAPLAHVTAYPPLCQESHFAYCVFFWSVLYRKEYNIILNILPYFVQMMAYYGTLLRFFFFFPLSNSLRYYCPENSAKKSIQGSSDLFHSCVPFCGVAFCV